VKFKKGERVRVKANSRFDEGQYAGNTGVVDRIVEDDPHPYDILFDDGDCCLFSGIELEKED